MKTLTLILKFAAVFALGCVGLGVILPLWSADEDDELDD